jgi:hypothetical protein
MHKTIVLLKMRVIESVECTTRPSTPHMATHESDQWLAKLGYTVATGDLHRPREQRTAHRYGPELEALLDPEGHIRAEAVFDVDGVPTICFLEEGGLLEDSARLDAIRKKIWNQNLVSIILVVGRASVTAVPVSKRPERGETLTFARARSDGPYSAADVQSGEIYARHPEWFRHEERVDAYLLRNLNESVRQLERSSSLDVDRARELVGQLLFVSYLEDRGIVSDVYRRERKVQKIAELIVNRARQGVLRLLRQLKSDFNGDFLEPASGEESAWKSLTEAGFEVAQRFLSGEEMATGQLRLWGYDFSFLPVELISGIYESFLSEEREKLGAYYTPRHLANLVVDQAFSGIDDLASQRIYDGACGSGILLTTAFRRILSHVEQRRGVLLSLAERIALLQSCIFGSDISRTACQMSAFSLYLSLLERLQPADLALLERGEGVKLPKLQGANLFSGQLAGDFFSSRNKLADQASFTIFLCNPPWKEPEKDVQSSADIWMEGQGSAVRRQLAAAFAMRSIGCIAPGGRVCLILPVSLFLAPTSQRFVTEWLQRVRLHRLTNFGDLRDVLFERAHHACVVVLGTPRPASDLRIPVEEQFEYWVPKADTSLALGRLTLRGEDRHLVQTQRVATSNQTLVTLSWGMQADVALCARLRLLGRLSDVTDGRFRSWNIRKGVHVRDASRQAQSSAPLRVIPHIPVESLQGDVPVVTSDLLNAFPSDIRTVVGLDDELLSVFRGPRVVFPDGPAPDLTVRAHFISSHASFTSSVGVIGGTPKDADLLRFLAVYLRSDLVRYFIVMSQYSVLVAQDRVTLKDLKSLPFILPEFHPQPELAREMVQATASFIRELTGADPLERDMQYLSARPKLQEMIYTYFGLSAEEVALVNETVRDVIPSIQPRGFSSLHTPLQYDAPIAKLNEYAQALQAELLAWRESSGGKGSFHVEVCAADAGAGRFAVVRVDLIAEGGRPPEVTSDHERQIINATLRRLRQSELLPMRSFSNIYLVADVVVLHGNSAYLVKPLQKRAWLRRAALRDAYRIVETARSAQRGADTQAA